MTWTAPAFVAQMKADLDADPILSALVPTLKVFTYWPSTEDRSTDAIILHRVRPGALESAAIGDENRSKDDIYTVEGQVEVLRAGAGEDVAAEVNNRVVEIFDRLLFVANERPSAGPGTQTIRVRVGDMDYAQFPTTSGVQNPTPVRVAVLAFGVEVRVRVKVAPS